MKRLFASLVACTFLMSPVAAQTTGTTVPPQVAQIRAAHDAAVAAIRQRTEQQIQTILAQSGPSPARAAALAAARNAARAQIMAANAQARSQLQALRASRP